jgi:hypothetical protein
MAMHAKSHFTIEKVSSPPPARAILIRHVELGHSAEIRRLIVNAVKG